MSDFFRNATAIAGVGETEYAKAGRATRAEFELGCLAVMRAVDDAGLELSDVDGLCAYSSERSAPVAVAQALGLGDLRFVNLYPGGGNSAAGIVHNAAIAVASGVATTVVCYRSICQGQTLRFGQGAGRSRAHGAVDGHDDRGSAGLPGAVRAVLAGAGVRARCAPAHVRVRDDERAVRRSGSGGLRQRAAEPPSRHVRAAADDRGTPGLARSSPTPTTSSTAARRATARALSSSRRANAPPISATRVCSSPWARRAWCTATGRRASRGRRSCGRARA